MIVIADTSPISELLTINQAELLQRVYGEVSIPHAVHSELLRSQLKLFIERFDAHPDNRKFFHDRWASAHRYLRTCFPGGQANE